MFSLTQGSGADDDLMSLDQFCRLCTSNGANPNAVVTGKNSCDVPSVTDDANLNTAVMWKNSCGVPSVPDAVFVGSDICDGPISSVGLASVPCLV
jgi:hypothetical protein